MMNYTTVPISRKCIKGYGFMSLSRNLSNKHLLMLLQKQEQIV